MIFTWNVQKADSLDKNQWKFFWDKVIKQELGNVLIVFQSLEDGKPIPVGSKKFPYNITIDVKHDLTRENNCHCPGIVWSEVCTFSMEIMSLQYNNL